MENRKHICCLLQISCHIGDEREGPGADIPLIPFARRGTTAHYFTKSLHFIKDRVVS